MIYGAQESDALLPPTNTTVPYERTRGLLPPSRHPRKKKHWWHKIFPPSDPDAPMGDYAYPGYPPGYVPPQAYPQQGYYPYGPGGLPTNRASLDVKAFIPAQYSHLQLHPASGMAIVAAGVVLVLLLQKHKG